MIDAVIDRFGLTRMPFGRDLPPGRLHRHADCAEAAARITWAVAGRTIGVVTGEVGTGKTAAVRAAVAALDPAGHNVIYIGNPATGVRGILAAAVTALGGRPVHGTAALAVQAWNVLAGEAAERGFRELMANCMRAGYSWARPGQEYLDIGSTSGTSEPTGGVHGSARRVRRRPAEPVRAGAADQRGDRGGPEIPGVSA
jgi:hypothetical protein